MPLLPTYDQLTRRSFPPRLTEHVVKDPDQIELVENICPSRGTDLFQYIQALARTFYAETPVDSEERTLLDRCLDQSDDHNILCILLKRIYNTLTVRPDDIRPWKDWKDVQKIYFLLTGPLYQAVFACAVSGHFERFYNQNTIKGFRFPNLKSTSEETYNNLMKKVKTDHNEYITEEFDFEHIQYMLELNQEISIISKGNTSTMKITTSANAKDTGQDGNNDGVSKDHGEKSCALLRCLCFYC